MFDNTFIDTNILVYAHDGDAGERHKKAAKLVSKLWEGNHVPCISVQVLQELHVSLLRKGCSIPQSALILQDYSQWRVIENSVKIVHQAIALQRTYSLSYWDASIIATALEAGCTTLWSEDLQQGQKFSKLVVRNPFTGKSSTSF